MVNLLSLTSFRNCFRNLFREDLVILEPEMPVSSLAPEKACIADSMPNEMYLIKHILIASNETETLIMQTIPERVS